MGVLGPEEIERHIEANEAFARSRGLSDGDTEELRQTYVLMSDVLDHPEKYRNPVARVTELEFQMQRMWKFPEDVRFHHYGLFINGCTCPRFDNFELVGHTENRYIASDCPWHHKSLDSAVPEQV